MRTAPFFVPPTPRPDDAVTRKELPAMQTSDIVANLLRDLNGDSVALLILARSHYDQVDEVLAKVEELAKGPTPREIALRYMATTSNAQLRRDLRETRGERSASCLKTKLHHDLKARSGYRVPNGNGRSLELGD